MFMWRASVILRKSCSARNSCALSQYKYLTNKPYRLNEYAENKVKKDESRLILDPNDEISPQQLLEKSSRQDWTNTFGSLTESSMRKNLVDESSADCEDEVDEPQSRLSSVDRKHVPDWYGKKIEKLGKQGKVYEAVQVIEKEMLVDDRVMPNLYVFTTLIGVLGRVGYTEKAFKVFNQMKKFGIKPDSPTYTALFNSCSNSPSREDGLKRAYKLRALMKDQDVVVNIITYQAMIKAFAHLGEVQTAFRIADEAMEEDLRLSPETFSFLMMACIADKESGFSLCIKVWRMMRKKRLQFDTFHYNLLLRSSRDCGIGSGAIFEDLLGPQFEKITSTKPKQISAKHGAQEFIQPNKMFVDKVGQLSVEHPTKKVSLQPKMIEDGIKELTERSDVFSKVRESSVDSLDHRSKSDISAPINFPNILNPSFSIDIHPGMSTIIPVTPSDRLLLLGGAENILKHMERDESKPTIKTFSLLMDMLPDTLHDEHDFLQLMAEKHFKPDVALLNALIRRRCLRKEFHEAKKVLHLMVQFGHQPDVRTFGCLAMGCSTETKGMRLLQDMLKLNVYPNVEICDILIYQSKMDFRYKLKLIDFMKDKRIRPNISLLKKLEGQANHARYMILKMERKEEVSDYYRSEEFLRWFENFKMSYKQWLTSVELEPEVHPWDPYKQPVPEMPEDPK